MKLRDLLDKVPGLDQIIEVDEYAERELGDAAMFGYLAAQMGFGNTAAQIAELRAAAVHWTARHGTPELEDVKRELGL